MRSRPAKNINALASDWGKLGAMWNKVRETWSSQQHRMRSPAVWMEPCSYVVRAFKDANTILLIKVRLQYSLVVKARAAHGATALGTDRAPAELYIEEHQDIATNEGQHG